MKRCTMTIVLVANLLISLLLLGSIAPAQTPTLWGDLKAGPHAVGFKTIEKYDYSRTFRHKKDLDGNVRDGERARPIQICIWYPAKETEYESKMVYGEYLFPNPEDYRFFDLLSRLQGREAYNCLFPVLGGNGSVLNELGSVKMAAIKNATPEGGRFPLIVYNSDITNGYSENVVMCEYLASHGFVVATTHSIGTSFLDPAVDLKDLETLVRDREFTIAQVQDWPNIDKNTLGVVGFSFGGLAALILQMRNTDVDAVISLDGWNVYRQRFEFIRQSAYFHSEKMRVPLLQLFLEDPETVDSELVDSFKYSERCLLRFKGAQRRDFTSYGMIASLVPKEGGVFREPGNLAYEATCLYVLNFLKAHLHHNANSMQFMKNDPEDNGISTDMVAVDFIPGEQPPPSEDQFVDIFLEDSVERGWEIYEKFKSAEPDKIFFREATLNNLGYDFLRMHRVDEAVEIFKINTDAYPASANTWSSLAEAYMYARNYELARTYFNKVLEMLPHDTTISDQVKERLRDHAQRYLQRLEGR